MRTIRLFTMKNKGPELDIIYYIKVLNKLMTADFDKRLNEHGLTCQQGRVLFYINHRVKEGYEIHQNDLEQRFNLSKSTVSGLVKRMEKNGLIIKNNNPPYRSLLPSDKGKAIVDQVHGNRIKVLEKLMDGINKEKQQEMNKLLKQMIENMEKEEDS